MELSHGVHTGLAALGEDAHVPNSVFGDLVKGAMRVARRECSAEDAVEGESVCVCL